MSLPLIALCVLSPALIFVDTLNGPLIRAGGFSISQPVKIVYLGLLVINALRFRQGAVLVSTIFFIDVVFAFIHLLGGHSLAFVIADFQWLLRINIAWLGAFVFGGLVFSGVLSKRFFHRTFVFVSLVLLANLMIGAAGHGYSQYDIGEDGGSIGTVGLIYAGNEMSFLMLLCQVMVSGYYYSQGLLRSFLAWSLLFLFAAVLKSTKTAIFGSVLITLMFFVMDAVASFSQGRSLSSRVMLLFFGVVAGFVAATPFIMQYLTDSGLIGRISYFMREYGVLFAVFSGREQFVYNFWEQFINDFSALDVAFGVGRGGFELVESDLFDILGAFGILGVILVYGFYLRQLRLSLLGLRRRASSIDLSLSILLMLLIAVSLVAGHVVNSGLAAAYIGLALGMGAFRYRNT